MKELIVSILNNNVLSMFIILVFVYLIEQSYILGYQIAFEIEQAKFNKATAKLKAEIIANESRQSKENNRKFETDFDYWEYERMNRHRESKLSQKNNVIQNVEYKVE